MHLNNSTPTNTPAVFVTAGETTGNGQPVGVWLELLQPFDQLTETLRAAGIVPATMYVADQVGLGPVMVDEDMSLSSLCGQVRPIAGEYRAVRR